MTEDQIERRAEHMQDALDRRFMDSRYGMSQAAYDAECEVIRRWVENQYALVGND